MRLALCILAIADPVHSQELPALFDVTGVAAGDVLNIRDQPSPTGAIVGAFARDEKGVEVVALDGNWAMVNTGEGTGYAALAYLAWSGGPDWNRLGTPLQCFGTEPFWSAVWSPERQDLTLTDFDTPPRTLRALQVWGAVPMSELAVIGMQDGTAILRGKSCSDGMSDFTYGIAIDLMLTGPGNRALYGCCSLILR